MLFFSVIYCNFYHLFNLILKCTCNNIFVKTKLESVVMVTRPFNLFTWKDFVWSVLFSCQTNPVSGVVGILYSFEHIWPICKSICLWFYTDAQLVHLSFFDLIQMHNLLVFLFSDFSTLIGKQGECKQFLSHLNVNQILIVRLVVMSLNAKNISFIFLYRLSRLLFYFNHFIKWKMKKV